MPLIDQAQADEHGEVIVLFDQSGSIKTYDSKFATKEWVINFVRANYLKYQISLVGFDEDNHFHFRIDSNQNKDIDTIIKNIEEIKTLGLATDFEKPFSYLNNQKNPEFIRLVLIISDGRPDIWDKKLDYLSKIIRADDRYSELNTLYNSLKLSDDTPITIYNKLFPLYFQKNLSYIDEKVTLVKKVFAGRIIIWDISGDSLYLKEWSKKLSAQYVSIPINNTRLAETISTIQKKADEILAESNPFTFNNIVKNDISKDTQQPDSIKDSTTSDVNKKEGNLNNMLQDNFIILLLILVIIMAVLLIIVYRKLHQKSLSTLSVTGISNEDQLLEKLRANKPVSSLTNLIEVTASSSIQESLNSHEQKTLIEGETIKSQDELDSLRKELALERAITEQFKERLKASDEQKIFFETQLHDIQSESKILKDDLAKVKVELVDAVNKINFLQSSTSADHRISEEQEIERLKGEIDKFTEENKRLKEELVMNTKIDQGDFVGQDLETFKTEFDLINSKVNDVQNELNKYIEENQILKQKIAKKDDLVINAETKDAAQEIGQLRNSLQESVEQRIVFEQEIERLKSDFKLINQRVVDNQNDLNKLAEENQMLKDEAVKHENNLIKAAALEVSNKDKLIEIDQLKVSLKESEQQRLDFEKKMVETISVYKQLEQAHSNYDKKLIEEKERFQAELDNIEPAKTTLTFSNSQLELNDRIKRMADRLRDYNDKESRYIDEIESLNAHNFTLRKQVESAIETVNLALTRIEQLKTEKAV
ncbi:MAG: hypothetical protein HQK91_01750 [Nitrospirae bacterium]|nr:hypothetical protein [Nitrospirota bacterium]